MPGTKDAALVLCTRNEMPLTIKVKQEWLLINEPLLAPQTLSLVPAMQDPRVDPTPIAVAQAVDKKDRSISSGPDAAEDPATLSSPIRFSATDVRSRPAIAAVHRHHRRSANGVKGVCGHFCHRRSPQSRSPGEIRRYESLARSSAALAPYRLSISRERHPKRRMASPSFPPIASQLWAAV